MHESASLNLTREAMNMWRNIDARSCNHCRSGKAICYIFWVYVCVCSLSYPACNVHVPYCHLRPAWLYSSLLNFFLQRALFLKKKRYWAQNVFCFINKLCLKYFFHSKKNWEISNKKFTLVIYSSSSIGTTTLSWVSACSTVFEHSRQEGFTECRWQRHVKPPTWRRTRDLERSNFRH
jgi:hypothetical protein